MIGFSTRKGKASYHLCAALPFFLTRPVNHSFFPLFFALFLAGLGISSVAAQAAAPLPQISLLNTLDMAFRQFLQDVEANRRFLFSSRQRLDALALAVELGNARVVNLLLLGLLAREMDFPKEAWLEAIEACVPPKTLEINRKAFGSGWDF